MDFVALVLIVGWRGVMLWRFGIYDWQDNDGVGYVGLAHQLSSGAALLRVPDLQDAAIALSLLRLPGYSLLIVAVEAITGPAWQASLIGVQLLLSIVASFLLYRTCRHLSGSALLGVAAAAAFSASEISVFERYVLTDAPFTALTAIVFCMLLRLLWDGRGPSVGMALGIGALLAAMALLRDPAVVLIALMTPLFVMVVWPIAEVSRRILALSLIGLIPLVALGAVGTWNLYRTGHVVLSTGGQTAFVWALSQVQKTGTPIFNGDGPLDRVAQEHLRKFDFSEVARINQTLHAQGYPAYDIARLARERYLQSWLAHPEPMLGYTLLNLESAKFGLLSQVIYGKLGAVRMAGLYSAMIQKTFVLTTIGLAVLWWLAAAFVPRGFFLGGVVVALIVPVWGTIAAVATINMEIRYVLFAIPAAALALAWTVGAIRRAMTSILAAWRDGTWRTQFPIDGARTRACALRLAAGSALCAILAMVPLLLAHMISAAMPGFSGSLLVFQPFFDVAGVARVASAGAFLGAVLLFGSLAANRYGLLSRS